MLISWWEKKSEEDEQTLEESNSAHRRSQPKWQLVPTSYWNELNCSCFCHIINILLTELSRSVWENLDLGRVYRPHCVRSVLTTSVKILPYRPPARLIISSYYEEKTSNVVLSTVNVVLSTALGPRPRAVLKTSGTVFSHTDLPPGK